jgi:NAD(P)H-flavin reductase
MKSRVEAIRSHTEEIRSIALRRAEGKFPPFIPGQYALLSRPGVQSESSAGSTSIRPRTEGEHFAMASAPEEEDPWEFLVRKRPGMAEALFGLRAGDEVEIEGPMGKGFSIDDYRGFHLLLIGVGTALAPLRSVIRSVVRRRDDFGEVALYYGVLTPKHFCYPEELAAWPTLGITVHQTVTYGEKDWSGPVGFVQDLLARHRPDPHNRIALVCGMPEMEEANIALLRRLGFLPERILKNY